MESAGMDKKFLIDGFPRNQDNLDGWNAEMTGHAKVEQVLFFDVPEDIMLSRIMKRSETSGRTDDNEEAAKKRFKIFRDETMPIIRHFDGHGLLLRVNADQGVEEVYKEISEGLTA
jgi:UMP-CMP kinase